MEKIPLTEAFDIHVNHELPKKLDDLEAVYTVISDFLKFPEDLKAEFEMLEYHRTKSELSTRSKEQIEAIEKTLMETNDFPVLYVNGGHYCDIKIGDIKVNFS